MDRSQIVKRLLDARLVAVVRGIDDMRMPMVLEALGEGGVTAVEFAFDHGSPGDVENNARRIENARRALGDAVLVGCGTALTEEETRAAHQAGARFAVTPVCDSKVISAARALDMAVMPGAMTPTEVFSAYEAGADIVKIFPAGLLGAPYIRALQGPLKHIPLFAVGGVEPEDVGVYLDAGARGFGLSTSLLPPAAVYAGDKAAVVRRVRAYVDALSRWEAER